MAHISIEKNGRSFIQFRHPSGKRHTLRLGKVAKRLAEGVLRSRPGKPSALTRPRGSGL
jgi:hypothetical protein